MARQRSTSDLARVDPALRHVKELRIQACAARMRAEAIHAWTRAVYNVSQHRMTMVRRSEEGPLIEEATVGQDVSTLLWQVLHAAIAVTEADCGNVQIVSSASGNLRIVAQVGFERPFLDYFDCVQEGSAACGAALGAGRRVVVGDLRTSAAFSAPARAVMLDANARAVQATPVLDRSGHVVAMISTHFQTRHQPSAGGLQLIDALARTVAPILAPRWSDRAPTKPFVPRPF